MNAKHRQGTREMVRRKCDATDEDNAIEGEGDGAIHLRIAS